jgi:hypothetical protein
MHRKEGKMTVACPSIEWPRFLEECGPAEDADIVLKGTAHIGATPLEVIAIRIDPRLRRAPDYRPDVPEAAYQTAALETTLEELEYLTEELAAVTGAAERSLVRLPAGDYVMWVLPAR